LRLRPARYEGWGKLPANGYVKCGYGDRSAASSAPAADGPGGSLVSTPPYKATVHTWCGHYWGRCYVEPTFFGRQRENTVKEDHNKAAEQHENAAKSHRAAADAHGKNDHAKGKEHSTQAQQHSQNARNQSQTAHEKSQQQK
jgi:hypothetical protein